MRNIKCMILCLVTMLMAACTFTLSPAITQTPSMETSYVETPTRNSQFSNVTQTSISLPVSDEVKNLFLNFFTDQQEAWNVKINLVNIGYVKNEMNQQNLSIGIQCVPGSSPCKPTMMRMAFIFAFADPVPDPQRMSVFPNDLASFKVFGYDEKMKLMDAFEGKWSDLMKYERGQMPYDELNKLLVEP